MAAAAPHRAAPGRGNRISDGQEKRKRGKGGGSRPVRGVQCVRDPLQQRGSGAQRADSPDPGTVQSPSSTCTGWSHTGLAANPAESPFRRCGALWRRDAASSRAERAACPFPPSHGSVHFPIPPCHAARDAPRRTAPHRGPWSSRTRRPSPQASLLVPPCPPRAPPSTAWFRSTTQSLPWLSCGRPRPGYTSAASRSRPDAPTPTPPSRLLRVPG